MDFDNRNKIQLFVLILKQLKTINTNINNLENLLIDNMWNKYNSEYTNTTIENIKSRLDYIQKYIATNINPNLEENDINENSEEYKNYKEWKDLYDYQIEDKVEIPSNQCFEINSDNLDNLNLDEYLLSNDLKCYENFDI